MSMQKRMPRAVDLFGCVDCVVSGRLRVCPRRRSFSRRGQTTTSSGTRPVYFQMEVTSAW